MKNEKTEGSIKKDHPKSMPLKVFDNNRFKSISYRIQPTGIRFSPTKGHSPLPPISTNGVLPLWLNLVLETV